MVTLGTMSPTVWERASRRLLADMLEIVAAGVHHRQHALFGGGGVFALFVQERETVATLTPAISAISRMDGGLLVSDIQTCSFL